MWGNYRNNRQAALLWKHPVFLKQGKTSVVVSLGSGVVGIIGLMDEIKLDSAAALKEIEAMALNL